MTINPEFQVPASATGANALGEGYQRRAEKLRACLREYRRSEVGFLSVDVSVLERLQICESMPKNLALAIREYLLPMPGVGTASHPELHYIARITHLPTASVFHTQVCAVFQGKAA